MKYPYLVFDVDGTLLDFNSAYSQAQRAVARTLKLAFSPEFVQRDEELSWKLWDEFGLSSVENADIQQRYHSLYESYLRKHFACIAEAFGVEADTEEVLNAYYTALSSSRKTMEPDTWEVYRLLSHRRKMIIATNGLDQVQRNRLKDFMPMTAGLYISERVGSIKPSQEFFHHILEDFGGAPCDYLMIGDSISCDIRGAKNAGMAACWYNPKGKPAPAAGIADYTITRLSELHSII